MEPNPKPLRAIHLGKKSLRDSTPNKPKSTSTLKGKRFLKTFRPPLLSKKGLRTKTALITLTIAQNKEPFFKIVEFVVQNILEEVHQWLNKQSILGGRHLSHIILKVRKAER